MVLYISGTVFGLYMPNVNFAWQREARKLKDSASTLSNQSYNMKDIVMPLLEYIHNPIAQDIIHNGATFQVS